MKKPPSPIEFFVTKCRIPTLIIEEVAGMEDFVEVYMGYMKDVYFFTQTEWQSGSCGRIDSGHFCSCV